MAQLRHPYPFMHQWLALHPRVASVLSREPIALLVVYCLALAGVLYLSRQLTGAELLESSGILDGGVPSVPPLNPSAREKITVPPESRTFRRVRIE